MTHFVCGRIILPENKGLRMSQKKKKRQNDRRKKNQRSKKSELIQEIQQHYDSHDADPIQGLEPQQRQQIQDSVDEYEQTLKKKYRRQSDSELIALERMSFRGKILERELKKENKRPEEIKKEDRSLINTTLVVSLLILAVFVVFALMMGSDLEKRANEMIDFCIKYLSWFYLLASTGFLATIIYLAFSRFGSVVLGDPDQPPEFSNLSWASMLFAAGMGVGLLFWGGAEPLLHYTNPPVGEGRTPEAGSMAMVYTALHWCLHGWGIYTICAIAVAYFGFRKHKKYMISSCIVELFDNPKIQYWLKAFSDISATLAVIFGMAASLGMGIMQFGSGLQHVFGIQATTNTGLTMIMIVITILFLISASTGLDKGIKILSNLNMVVAIILMFFVLLVGPKLFILKLFVDSIGKYLNELFVLSFQTLPMVEGYDKWLGIWTVKYFTWWIAWAPFVGIFLARISRGRTIRELVTGSLLIPTAFSLLWFSVFGGTAIFMDISGNTALSEAVNADVTTALFALLSELPLYKVTATASLGLILVFLVTSADSATFVIAMMTSEGDLDPGTGLKLVWGVVMSTVTLLLVLGGGIDAISAAALACAFPFTFVLVLMVFSLMIRLGIQVKKDRI